MSKSHSQIQPQKGPDRAFGEALKEVRRERGLSQMDLYLASGIDRTYISLIERGIRSPTIRMVARFAKYLKVSPSELVQRMEQSKWYSERDL